MAHGRSPLCRPPYDLTVELKVTLVSGARSDRGSQSSGRPVPVRLGDAQREQMLSALPPKADAALPSGHRGSRAAVVIDS